MRTLIYGAGPIGQWLALRLHHAGQDVTLLARSETLSSLQREGIRITDALTGSHQQARLKLTDRLAPNDRYDLVVVPMQKAARLAACTRLAQNHRLKSVLFLGNDVSGFSHYLDHLDPDRVLLGFPGVGGGWEENELVIMDRESPKAHHGEIFFGELDGRTRRRTLRIRALLESADIKARVEPDMSGWLKYHFAFMAPTADSIFKKSGDLKAVASDKETIHQYCRACRQAGNVLAEIGYRRRQPHIFNLYYWLPRWLEPRVFGRLFASRSAEIRFGLHSRSVGPELLEMAEEFEKLKARARMGTPDLDALLEYVSRPATVEPQPLKELVS